MNTRSFLNVYDVRVSSFLSTSDSAALDVDSEAAEEVDVDSEAAAEVDVDSEAAAETGRFMPGTAFAFGAGSEAEMGRVFSLGTTDRTTDACC